MRQRGGASKNNGRPTELVFVNPGHADHLKKVIYRREIDGRLTARIEGDNGGKVFAVPQQEVPDGQAMAAVFRY